jgi:hypothetical protein
MTKREIDEAVVAANLQCQRAIAALRALKPDPEPPKLKPCPACGGKAARFALYPDGGPVTRCCSCRMNGPVDDPDGAKWNALPRRDALKPTDPLAPTMNAAADTLKALLAVVEAAKATVAQLHGEPLRDLRAALAKLEEEA